VCTRKNLIKLLFLFLFFIIFSPSFITSILIDLAPATILYYTTRFLRYALTTSRACSVLCLFIEKIILGFWFSLKRFFLGRIRFDPFGLCHENGGVDNCVLKCDRDEVRARATRYVQATFGLLTFVFYFSRAQF
jgi:hypothetical protein